MFTTCICILLLIGRKDVDVRYMMLHIVRIWRKIAVLVKSLTRNLARGGGGPPCMPMLDYVLAYYTYMD